MRLPLLLAISVISAANAEQNVARPKPAIERAIEAFKRQTRDLGLRAAGVGEQSGRNSFRNDYLDAVPYEVRQRGKDKSVLRRNQFGFSVAGPVVVPGLVHRGSGTYFTLNAGTQWALGTGGFGGSDSRFAFLPAHITNAQGSGRATRL